MTKHVFEIAPSGRSKCRGCGKAIAKDELRFGEKMPNPFGDGDMTHWLHPNCAAHRRPEPFLEALDAGLYEGDDQADLKLVATRNLEHRRIPRLGAAERASSGRARCRHCKELIEQGAWRLPLIFFEEGSYNTSGFIHAGCAAEYCEVSEPDLVWPTIEAFAQDLSTEDLDELKCDTGA